MSIQLNVYTVFSSWKLLKKQVQIILQIYITFENAGVTRKGTETVVNPHKNLQENEQNFKGKMDQMKIKRKWKFVCHSSIKWTGKIINKHFPPPPLFFGWKIHNNHKKNLCHLQLKSNKNPESKINYIWIQGREKVLLNLRTFLWKMWECWRFKLKKLFN